MSTWAKSPLCQVAYAAKDQEQQEPTDLGKNAVNENYGKITRTDAQHLAKSPNFRGNNAITWILAEYREQYLPPRCHLKANVGLPRFATKANGGKID